MFYVAYLEQQIGLLAKMEAKVDTLSPHTTKKTTNLKTKNQNCQIVELYGNMTTEKLK